VTSQPALLMFLLCAAHLLDSTLRDDVVVAFLPPRRH